MWSLISKKPSLSQFFIEVCTQVEKNDGFVKATKKTYLYKFAMQLFSYLLVDRRQPLGHTVFRLHVSEDFFVEKEYVLSFLLMCESVLNGEVPKINHYNKDRFDDFKKNKWVKPIYDDDKICGYKCNKSKVTQEYKAIAYRFKD